jgi:hypothetical protein
VEDNNDHGTMVEPSNSDSEPWQLLTMQPGQYVKMSLDWPRS